MLTKRLSNVEIKDAEQGLVQAVFATFDVRDLDGDVVMKGAIQDGAPVIISSYGHRSWDGELPVGSGVIIATDTEAILDGKFFLNTSAGRETFETVKGVSATGQQEWSWSLDNVTAHRGDLDGRSTRFIESVDITEVSPVLKGSSINTRTLATKERDDDSDDDAESAMLSTKFSERADAALRGVKQLVEMAVERLALRAFAGKSISEQTDVYDRLCAELAALKAAIDEHTANPPDDDRADEIFAAALASFAAHQGART